MRASPSARRRCRSLMASLIEHRLSVAAHPRESRTRERCVAVEARERVVIHLEQCRQLRCPDLGAWRESDIGGRLRKTLIPGAHVLADVAAEDPRSYVAALLLVERAAVLDREIR